MNKRADKLIRNVMQKGEAVSEQAGSVVEKIKSRKLNPKQQRKKALGKKNNRYKSGKALQDNMAITKIFGRIFWVCLIFLALLYYSLQKIHLPYSGFVTNIPVTLTQIADKGGIFVTNYSKDSRYLAKGALIIAVQFSTLERLSPSLAVKLANIRLVLSRLETQKMGKLTWSLPDDLRQRAFQNDKFTKFVVAQQKKFDDYYDSLDQYGRDIYIKEQRLQDRIVDINKTIAGFYEEKKHINARIIEVASDEKLLLRNEIVFIDADIVEAEAIKQTLSAELLQIEPRLQRVIARKASEIEPEIGELYQKRNRLYMKLGISPDQPPSLFSASRNVTIGEIMPHDIGDVFNKGQVLYRLLPDRNAVKDVVITAYLPDDALKYMKDAFVDRICMLNVEKKEQCLQTLSIQQTVIDEADYFFTNQVLYKLSVEDIYKNLYKLPVLNEDIRLYIGDNLQSRLQGFWLRGKERRRSLSLMSLPFLNRKNLEITNLNKQFRQNLNAENLNVEKLKQTFYLQKNQ